MSQKFRPAFFLFLLFCTFSTQHMVFGRDIFVDNVHGNDDFSGHNDKAVNDNGPLRTIAHALEIAERGDTIILANSGEPYRESVTISGQKHSAAPGFPFTVQGNGATLDGSIPIPVEWWRSYGNGIFYFQPEFMQFQNLFKDGIPLRCIRFEQKNNVLPKIELESMQWCLCDGKIYFKPEKNRLPRDYNLTCTGLRHGIALFHVKGVEIRDLIVQGYQNDGIIASNNATEVFLRNVTSRGNARAGVVSGGGSTVWLIECTLGNNLYAQLLTENFSQTSLFDTELIANSAPGWVEGTGWAQNLNNTPDSDVNKGIVFRDGKQIFDGLSELVEWVDPAPQEDLEIGTEVVEETIAEDSEDSEDGEISIDDLDSEESSEDEESDSGFDFGTDESEEMNEEESEDDSGFDFGMGDDDDSDDSSDDDDDDDGGFGFDFGAEE